MIRVVCFDIGGVLAHVNLNWYDAIRAAGLEPKVSPGGALEDCPAFGQFQSGQIGLEDYLTGLADFCHLAPSQALAVHDGILDRPTEGTLEIVRRLNQTSVVTACLSNTNAPHWDWLTSHEKFPNIASLQLKRASHLYGVSKPSPEIYARFETDAGVRPDEILFFEDNLANLTAANERGWMGAQIDPKVPQAPQIESWLDQCQLGQE